MHKGLCKTGKSTTHIKYTKQKQWSHQTFIKLFFFVRKEADMISVNCKSIQDQQTYKPVLYNTSENNQILAQQNIQVNKLIGFTYKGDKKILLQGARFNTDMA